MKKSSIVLSTVLGAFALIAFQPQAFAAGPDAKKDPKPAPAPVVPAPKPAPAPEDPHAAALKMLKALKDTADADLKALKGKNDASSKEKAHQAEVSEKINDALTNLANTPKKESDKGSTKARMSYAWVISAITQLSLETQKKYEDTLEAMTKNPSPMVAERASVILAKLKLPNAKDEHPIPELLPTADMEKLCSSFMGACRAQAACPSPAELAKRQLDIMKLRITRKAAGDDAGVDECDEQLEQLDNACKVLGATDLAIKKLPTKSDPKSLDAVEQIGKDYAHVTDIVKSLDPVKTDSAKVESKKE